MFWLELLADNNDFRIRFHLLAESPTSAQEDATPHYPERAKAKKLTIITLVNVNYD